MKFYKYLITIGLLTILSVNLFLSFHAQTLLDFFLVFVICCVPSGIILIITRLFPEKFYSAKNKLFFVFKFEKAIYEKLGVKKWKDKIPELGKLTSFKKDKIYDPKNKNYIAKYINENCKAEILHLLSALWGFIALFLMPNRYILFLGLPIASLNAFVHILPVIIQRYMRPRLVHLFNRLEYIEEKETINKFV